MFFIFYTNNVEVSAATALICQLRHPGVIVSVNSCGINLGIFDMFIKAATAEKENKIAPLYNMWLRWKKYSVLSTPSGFMSDGVDL